MSAGLVVGIGGSKLDAADRRMLEHPAVVGVILFSRNYRSPDQLRGLCGAIRTLKQPRLLICVDQEGGRVQRFREGFTRLPPLAELGVRYRSHPERALDLAYRHGRVMAAEVLGHGLDLSLAPVLDLQRGSGVIGDRAFSSDPENVAMLARHYLAGMRDAGMKSCGKHFPGHGSVVADTHTEIVTDGRTRAGLETDLQPFKALTAELDSIMPAHVCYPCVDNVPAGFSSRWLGILRRELGFGGVVVSDDLDMAGAGVAGSTLDRWRAAGVAGCDLALVCEPASAISLATALEPDAGSFEPARQAAAALLGRAAFSLEEQQLVPEFGAWKKSLELISGEPQRG